MNFQKEYQKVKDLIENRREILSDENLKALISGYQDYFDTYGKDMTALVLRDFRRGILSTISISQNRVPAKDGDDMEKIRAKVKSIHNELKNRK